MITLLTSGQYKLIETKAQIKILYLDDTAYAWVQPLSIGELLVASHSEHKTDCILATGEYRLYYIENEPGLSSHEHLELSVGDGQWQGYLLLTGLPTHLKKRRRIVPTGEVVTGVRYDVPAESLSGVLASGMQKSELL